ncbi:alpha/beta hydrolase [Desulfocarbo indianensis]|nr:alpha/beta hydrolase [Desulfocarbo indianensis]
MTETIFMIHGMWGRPHLWDNYKAFFQERGFDCLTPTLRLHDVSPVDPPAGLGSISLLDYAADLEAQVRGLPQEPIIMGHSMGGLLAQMLAARGLGKAAVFLTPVSPAGILALRWSVIRAFRSSLLRWGFWRRPTMPTFNEASHAMMHLLAPEAQREAYGRLVHDSGRAAAEIGLWLLDRRHASRVDEKNIKCPVLVIAGGQDRITPAPVVRKIGVKYAATGAYKEFPRHAHWVIGEPGWQEVAEYIHKWLMGMALV